jgi:hypothetical protein
MAWSIEWTFRGKASDGDSLVSFNWEFSGSLRVRPEPLPLLVVPALAPHPAQV